VVLLEVVPNALPMASVAEFMLRASQDHTADVAGAAMEFWIPCCNLVAPGSDHEPMLVAILPRLISVLLEVCRGSMPQRVLAVLSLP
jgi:hypothetical protein